MNLEKAEKWIKASCHIESVEEKINYSWLTYPCYITWTHYIKTNVIKAKSRGLPMLTWRTITLPNRIEHHVNCDRPPLIFCSKASKFFCSFSTRKTIEAFWKKRCTSSFALNCDTTLLIAIQAIFWSPTAGSPGGWLKLSQACYS